MSFQKYATEDMRLCILRILVTGGNYSHNEYVLRQALKECAHNVGSDRVRTEIAWLAEQGLVEKCCTDDALWTARLTLRGKDVADGLSVVPGVKRPEPDL